MSKRHYIAIAKIFKESNDKKDIVLKMLDLFKRDNPNFDTDRFIKACQ